MSLVHHVEILPLHCIQPTQGIEICPVDSLAAGFANQVKLSSHETNIVHIAEGVIEDLFVHHYQTDQLLTIKGSAVLAILQNRRYQYILMSDCDPKIVRIPPGIPHGAINLSNETCVVINSVIRHGKPYPKDYQPIKLPFPYDLTIVKAMMAEKLIKL